MGFGAKREGSGETEPTGLDSGFHYDRQMESKLETSHQRCPVTGVRTYLLTACTLPAKYMGASRDVLAPPRPSESMVAPRWGRLVSTSALPLSFAATFLASS